MDGQPCQPDAGGRARGATIGHLGASREREQKVNSPPLGRRSSPDTMATAVEAVRARRGGGPAYAKLSLLGGKFNDEREHTTYRVCPADQRNKRNRTGVTRGNAHGPQKSTRLC